MGHAGFLTIILSAYVQLVSGQNYNHLEVNDIRMRMRADGTVAPSGQPFNSPGYELPLGSGMSLLRNSGLWFSGSAPDGTPRVAVHLYHSIGRDLFPGPLRNDGTASADPAVSQLHDRVWSVARADVVTHLTYFNCLNDPDCDVTQVFPGGYSVPASLLDWPAMNTAPDHDPYLAPFFDRDGDGNYDPMLGDAPCILGDQALFLVCNDMLQPHGMSGGEGVGLEVHVMPFAFTGKSPALEQTVFLRYRVINRSNTVYEDSYVGFFNDFDIGCSNDDFIGTDPLRNLFYAYNWQDVDAPCFGNGYGPSPPAFGMTILKGPRVDPDGIDTPAGSLLPAWNGWGYGDGVPDNERHGLSRSIYWNRFGPTAMTDPTATVHYRQYMETRWKDGSPMTYGGTGYSTAPEAMVCNFMYPGDNDPVGAGTNGIPQPPWYETGPTPAQPDRRGLMSSGPFTLGPSEHLDLLFAYVYARSTGGALASVAALQARTDSVIAFAQTLPIWSMGDAAGWGVQCEDYLTIGIAERTQRNNLTLFPSPTSSAFHFDAPDPLVGAQLVVRDVTGREVHQQRVLAGVNRVDLQQATPGMYFCEVITGQARSVGRVVKE